MTTFCLFLIDLEISLQIALPTTNPSVFFSDLIVFSVIPKPITKENFSKFGDLITTKDIKPITINDGYAKRFDNIAELDTAKDNGEAVISIFSALKRTFPNESSYDGKPSFRKSSVHSNEGNNLLMFRSAYWK